MKGLILSGIMTQKRMLQTKMMQKEATGIQCAQRQLAFASMALLISGLSTAATPLADSELTNSFLNNKINAAQLVSTQTIQLDNLERQLEAKQFQLKPEGLPQAQTLLIDFSKTHALSNTLDSIDHKTRKQTISDNSILSFFGILNDLALNNIDSKNYRLTDDGLSLSYDLSEVKVLHYDNSTGSYEVQNIRGIVEIYVEPYSDDRSAQFRRANYVF